VFTLQSVRRTSTVAQVVAKLEESGAMEYTTVVAAPHQLRTITIYCTLRRLDTWRVFQDNGKHALVIYDDLSKQAAAYRELSLY